MMLYERNRDGLIVAAYNRPQPGKELEALADDHPDVIEFRAEPEPEPDPVIADLLQRVEVLEEAEATRT